MGKHSTSRQFGRSDRVAQQMQKELAELVRLELKDPRIGFVTITGVEVTRDSSHAKVYFTLMGDVSPEAQTETQYTLSRAAGFLRSELGKRIRMYSIPQLQFVFDQSSVRGAEISALIDQALGRESPMLAAQHQVEESLDDDDEDSDAEDVTENDHHA